MIAEALVKHQARLADDARQFLMVLQEINDPANLTPFQALMLASVVYELSPRIILDLGTGLGNSAAIFGLVGSCTESRTYTFDLHPYWDAALEKISEPNRSAMASNVVACGDITTHDFSELLGDQAPVLIFWDAHGFKVAQQILSTILPIIADRPHLVICHDMTDNRYAGIKSYMGNPIWDSRSWPTAYVNISWVCSYVEQAITIVDFCWRNDLIFHSAEEDIANYRTTYPDRWANFLRAIAPIEFRWADVGYFSMTETEARHFPAVLE